MRFELNSCLTNCDATGYHQLGAGSNESSACEISQAHPTDLPKIPKFVYIRTCYGIIRKNFSNSSDHLTLNQFEGKDY